MSVDTQQQTVEKTVIFQAGSILSDLQLVFSLPVSSNFIGVRSSKHFLSNIENDIEADLCDCEFNIIRLDAMEKISCTISSSDQNSIKIKTAKVLKKNAQYYLVISSKKACLSTSIAMNISIDIFNPSEENVIYSTHTLNISPKPMKSICIDVPSAISSGQSIYAIIKYLDKFGNITKPKNINNLRLVSLNIEKLDGSVISTGVKWSILEPKNGYAFLSGMQVHETGAYFITLNFEGKCIAKSNIFYVSGSGTPYYYKSIHWNYSNPIANSQSIDKITYRLFPTHYAESISPFVVNKGIYEANAFISKVPVNINFDVITLNAINESKDCYALHYKNPSTSIHKCAGKLNISHATSYDARRSISRYIKLSNIYSWDDPNLQKNKEDIFVDIKLFNKISIHEVISRLKVAYSKRSKYPLALYSLSSESNDAHNKTAIVFNHHPIKNESFVVDSFMVGSTYVSTGYKPVIYFSIAGEYPSVNSLKVSKKVGLKYNRNIKLFVCSKEVIDGVYIVKNDSIVHTIKGSDYKYEISYEYDDSDIMKDQTIRYYVIVKCKNGNISVTSPICITKE